MNIKITTLRNKDKVLVSKVWQYLMKNRAQIYLLMGVFILLYISQKIPYINIVVTESIRYIIFMLAAVFLLQIKGKILLGLSLVFLPFMFVLLVTGQTDKADELGNIMFISLLVASLLLLKDINRRHE